MGVASFDYATWVATYPEFSTVTQAQATAQFNVATLFLNNTDTSPVTDLAVRSTLLNMVTAHLVKLFVPINGVAPSGLVGRVSSATEGSVTVSTDYAKANTYNEAWWNQTPYGAQYWAATVAYRSMRYVPGPMPYRGPGLYVGRRGWPQ